MENQELLERIEAMLEGRLRYYKTLLKLKRKTFEKGKKFNKGRVNAVEKIIDHLQHFKAKE